MSGYTVTPSLLGDAAKTVINSAEQYRQLAGSLEKQVVDLNAYWKGIDYDAFKGKMQEVITALSVMADKLDADAKIIEQDAANYTARVNDSLNTLPR